MKLLAKKSLLLIGLGIAMAITSCQEEFSEEEYLKLKADLKEAELSAEHARDLEKITAMHANALALQNDAQAHEEALMDLQEEIEMALAEFRRDLDLETDSIEAAIAIRELEKSGLIFSYSLQVTDDDTPVAGVSVTMSNQKDETMAAGRTATGVTNNDGIVQFYNVAVGYSLVRISKEGYLPATLGVYFPLTSSTTGSNPTANPISRAEYNTVNIFSLSAASGSTATIKGKVTIETNLVNDTPEVPQNIQIKANFRSLGEDYDYTDGAEVWFYTFDESAGIGVGNVDNTTGEFEMVVPADANGETIQLIVPTIEADQVLGIVYKDDQMVGPKYDTIRASFGPNISYDTWTPWLPGAKAVFDQPTLQGGGKGFALEFTPLPSALSPTAFPNLNLGEQVASSSSSCINNAIGAEYYITLNNRGSGYSISPAITVTGDGTGAKVFASLRGFISSITTDGGVGYTPGENLTISIDFEGVNYSDDDDKAFINVASFVINGAVKDDGTLPTNLNLPNSYAFVESNPFYTENINATYGYRIIGWRATLSTTTAPTTTANATVTATAKVNGLRVADGGSGYTTAPALAFASGGAAATISGFETYWKIGLDNSNVTEPYSIIPYLETAEYYGTSTSPDDIDQIDYSPDARYAVEPTTDCQLDDNLVSNFMYQLKVDDNGNIAWMYPGRTYITEFRSSKAPTFIWIDPEPIVAASAYVNINSDGTFDDLYNIDSGWGYTEQFGVSIMPMIDGEPGSGAAVKLYNGEFDGQVFDWYGDYEIISVGSGYKEEVNIEDINKSLPGSQFVKSGETYYLEFRYGTGKRLVNVNGFD